IVSLPRSGTTLFASFSGKRRPPLTYYLLVLSCISSAKRNNAFWFFFWKKNKTTSQLLARSFWYVFRKAEQRFLVLFLEKEQNHLAIACSFFIICLPRSGTTLFGSFHKTT